MGFSSSASSGKIPCRKCGFPIARESSLCGNCGTPTRGRLGQGTPAATQVPGGFIRFLVVLALVALGIFLLRDRFTEVVESVSSVFQPAETEVGSGESTRTDPQGVPIEGGQERTKGFRSVRDVARSLNKGGLACRSVRVDAENDYVSSGSCRARGTHVQINVYLDAASLHSVRASFSSSDYPFAFVVSGNTYVIAQTPVARRVHRIIGGKLRVPN